MKCFRCIGLRIVHERDPVGRAHHLEPVRNTGEHREPAGDLLRAQAGVRRHGRRRHDVLAIVCSEQGNIAPGRHQAEPLHVQSPLGP